MRRYISILIMAISIAVTSCNNMLVKEPAAQEEKARVSLAVGNPSSRTILPEAYDEVASLKNFTFTATGTTGAKVTHTFTDYDTLQEAQLFFTPDTYDCSLSVTSTAGVKYEGVLEDKGIAPGDNVLAFTLQVVQLSAEPGSLEVQLTFPREKVQVVKAGLYSITGEVLSSFSEEVLEITDGNTVTYSNASVPGGNHLIKFSFYGDADCTVLLGTHTEVVVIVSGNKSAAIRSIESINPMYTITYELDGGSFVEGYTPPRKFTPNMELQLPKVSEVQKPGEGLSKWDFSGWYEDVSFAGSPVDSLSRGTGENKTYYARWDPYIGVDAATVSTLDLSGMTGECKVVVTDEINESTISTLKSKISAAGASAKIRLDLSQTTGLTSIGERAFYGCSGLTSVEIPAGVTSIGSSAFSGCSGLTSVEIPAGVTSIGSSAFSGCSGLTSVEIPAGVTSIGSSAFSGCSGLTSVEIPASVTSIGASAFEGCSGLTSVEIPAGVTSIGSSAFSGCSGLTSVEIPAGVTSIGSRAFYGCSGLTSVEIPAGVTSIGSRAFYECSGLARVTFGEGSQLTDIGNSAFWWCIGLTSVEIPASVTSIGIYAFDGCSKLTSVYYQGDLDRWCAGFGDGNHYLMSYCENLYIKGEIVQGDLVIPAGVTSIGEGAFSGCSGLTSVEIPAGVTSIGYSAFHGCSGLTSVEIPAGVTSIGSRAFYECRGLTSVEIPAGVTSIGEGAFSGCSGLTSVEIPAGVTSIGSWAFGGCSGLTSVTFGEGSQLESIDSSAFRECSGLTSVEIPASVTSIGIYAFDGCSKLTSVTFWDTSGWYVTTYYPPTGGSAVPLSPTNLAANARLVNDTFHYYYWHKVD